MKRSNNLSVGIFVSIALLLFVVFTVWVTGRRGSEPTAGYSILFQDDVSGLGLGGPVFFMGVRVGEVVAMVITPGDPPSIRTDVRILASTPVDTGTWATLAPQGITGVSVINLANDPGKHSALAAVEGFDLPLIPYRDSGFSAILSSAPALLQKMDIVLARAADLLDEQNQAALTLTLNNMAKLSEALAAEEQSLASLPASLERTLADVRAAVADTRGLLADASPKALASLDNLEQATAGLSQLVTRIDSWTAANDEGMQDFMGDGLGQVPGLVTDLRSVLRELEMLLDELRDNPSGVLYKSEDSAVKVEE